MKTEIQNSLASFIPRRLVVGVLATLLSLLVLPLSVLAETDWPVIVEQAALTVVLIEAELAEEDLASYGSGAIVSSDGYLVTAYHVIEDAVSINVYVPTASGQEEMFTKYTASVVEFSEAADVAVLKISADGLPSLVLGNTDDVKYEDEIRVLGYPLPGTGVGMIAVSGKIQGFRLLGEANLLQHDAPTESGHSGGAVINDRGELIGVHTGYIPGDHSSYTLGVAISTVKSLLPTSVSGGSTAPALPVATPSTWAIYGYSGKHLFIIPGNPAVGYPTPMPRPLPVEWAASVIVGPDGMFYCSDPVNGEIVRFDPLTREPIVIFEGIGLYPSDLAFDLQGNLLFSTYDRDISNSGASMGIWRIPGAAPGANAEKIINGTDIGECGVLKLGCRFGPPTLCVLSTGPYRGDILVSGRGDTPIARAVGPDYETLVAFIQEPESTYQSGDEDPIPAILGQFIQISSTGDVFATDFINHRILQFSSEGRFLGVFCDLYRANRLTSDYAGNIYATGSVWGSRSLQHIAGYSPAGTLLFQLPINDVVGVVILEK